MGYYGEHNFQMQYKNIIGEPFDWLYIDADTLKEKAVRNGYQDETASVQSLNSQNPVPVSGSNFLPMAPPIVGRSSISAV